MKSNVFLGLGVGATLLACSANKQKAEVENPI